MHAPEIEFELSQELTDIPLPIIGEFPDWLSGVLIRNGPVQFRLNGQQVAHWFDGLGMLHAFQFKNGKLKYSNRFLRSNAFFQVTEKGTLNYVGFASDPCRTLFKRLKAFFFQNPFPLHNANINLAEYGQKCVALYETPLPVRFDPQTLETLGVFEYHDSLQKASCFESAHPHYDSIREEFISYLVEYGFKSKYIIYRLKKGSQTREILAEVPIDNPSYMHSFALTEHYVIFVEYPFVVNSMDFLLKNLPFIKNYKWKPERGTRFLIIERETGRVVHQLHTEPFFSFHHVNAYENNDQIHLDLITYPDTAVIDELAHHSFMKPHTTQLEPGKESFQTSLKRFQFSLDSNNIYSETIFNETHELPRINSNFDGHFYRYIYAADIRKPYQPNDQRKIYKIDVQNKNVTFWREDGCYPGEPIFIPLNREEDQGVVLTVMMNFKKEKSFLLCLDAKNFTEIARAEVPHQIPEGLHGQYFSETRT